MGYKLKLQNRSKFHPTFHVSFLKPHHSNPNSDEVQTKWNPPMIRVEFNKVISSFLKDKKMGN